MPSRYPSVEWTCRRLRRSAETAETREEGAELGLSDDEGSDSQMSSPSSVPGEGGVGVVVVLGGVDMTGY